MADKPTTSLKEWKFQERHVQQNLVGGDFIGSHSTILCATVPRLSDLPDAGAALRNTVIGSGTEDLGNEIAIPIGVIDSASMQQDRQMAQIFEIGSKRSYILAARTVGALNIARVLYKGPSLLRMLYAFYPASKLGASIGDPTSNILRDLQSDSGTQLGDMPVNMSSELQGILPDIKSNPGYDNFFMNLFSDLLSQPHGLILYMKDNHENDVGAVFLEECYVQNHAASFSANSIVVAENMTLRFERIVPIKVRVRDLARQATSSGLGTFQQFSGAFGVPSVPFNG